MDTARLHGLVCALALVVRMFFRELETGRPGRAADRVAGPGSGLGCAEKTVPPPVGLFGPSAAENKRCLDRLAVVLYLHFFDAGGFF